MCKPCKLVPNVFLNGSVCIAHRDMSAYDDLGQIYEYFANTLEGRHTELFTTF